MDSPVTVITVWRKDGIEFTTFAHRTVIDTASISGSALYQAQVVFDPVQLSTDDGQYSCEVIVNAGVEFVMQTSVLSKVVSLSAAGIVSYIIMVCVYYVYFSISVPTLMASMQPESGSVLDMPPFNTFTLRCAARAPDSVLLRKSFQWREGGTVISDNGNTLLISHRNTSMPQSISELIVSGLSVGRHTFFCTVSISIPGGVDLTIHASGIVTVKGRFDIIHLHNNLYNRDFMTH